MKNKIKKLFLASVQWGYGVYSWCVYNAFRVLPIKKGLVVMATRKSSSLEGNFSYIYEELVSRNIHVELYFLQKLSVKTWLSHPRWLAQCEVLILDDYYRPIHSLRIRKGTRVIQVWHAAGAFKKFGFSQVGAPSGNSYRKERRAHKNYTDVVVSSSYVIGKYAEAFGVPECKIHPLGLPRSDFFFDTNRHDTIIANLKQKYHIFQNNKRKILYAPTFRGDMLERKQFTCPLDFSLLKSVLDTSVLIVKLHPAVEDTIFVPEELQNCVIDLSSEPIEELMILADLLITDYSSIIFEYSLLYRPMIFFPYDLDIYLDHVGLYEEYRSLVPGEIAMNMGELVTILAKDTPVDIGQLYKFNIMYHEHKDGQATKRFVDYFFT